MRRAWSTSFTTIGTQMRDAPYSNCNEIRKKRVPSSLILMGSRGSGKSDCCMSGIDAPESRTTSALNFMNDLPSCEADIESILPQ